MNTSLRVTSLLFVTTLIAAACGGNVVVDGLGSGTGTSNGGAGGAPGAGGGFSDTSSMVGVGASSAISVTSGGGFFGVGSSTIATATATSSVATVSVSASSSTTSSGAVGGCTQGSDPADLQSPALDTILVKCVEANLGNEGGLSTCLEQSSGLSGGCVMCLVPFAECAVMHCLTNCAPPNQQSAACIACESLNCSPAFVSCAGEPAPM